MTYIVFDTETDGLPAWKLPSDHQMQPHIVQFAGILYSDEHQELEVHNHLVKPDGWIIPPNMIHGISHERAMDEGISEKEVTDIYRQYLRLPEGSSFRSVAHNLSFDQKIMRIAMLRYGLTRPEIETLELVPTFCTMRHATPIVNLPPTEKMIAAGFNKPKTCSLSEAIRFFFNEELDGAHDAINDVRGAQRIYRHLLALSASA